MMLSVLEAAGDALRAAGFRSVGDLEFSLFGSSWIGDKIGVRGGLPYHQQDRHCDYQEKLSRLSPGTLAIVKEMFRLSEPGLKMCLAMMGFLGEEYLPQTRAKKAALEDLKRLERRAITPNLPRESEKDFCRRTGFPARLGR